MGGIDAVWRLIKRAHSPKQVAIPLSWSRRHPDAWLASQFAGQQVVPPVSRFNRKIEELAETTNQLGEQALWEGYPTEDGRRTRLPNEVRTSGILGDFYSQLVVLKKPRTIVEVGSGFGVSGMYWAAGLEQLGEGELLTFEPNRTWADIARRNIGRVSNRFTLVNGMFEENIERSLPGGKQVDISFIDAIHTCAFVLLQMDLLLPRSAEGGLILLDDINFSDDMEAFWQEISTDSRFAASVALGHRVGLLELAR